jgi:hypothetical protein
MLRITKSHSAEGFDKLDKFGTIQEIANDVDRLAAIAEKHIEAFKAQRSSLIIAPTHGECRPIAGRRAKGDEGEGSKNVPEGRSDRSLARSALGARHPQRAVP